MLDGVAPRLIRRSSGSRRLAPLRPARAGWLVSHGVPGNVGKEPFESPGAARRIGAWRLHRIAYRRETTLEPDPLIAG
jgi:hypothetical protein